MHVSLLNPGVGLALQEVQEQGLQLLIGADVPHHLVVEVPFVDELVAVIQNLLKAGFSVEIVLNCLLFIEVVDELSKRLYEIFNQIFSVFPRQRAD